jgi:hypothetical protein
LPRFYSTPTRAPGSIPDSDGFEYADLEAAERAALETARNFGRDLLAKDGAHEVAVDLRDGHKQLVATITVTVRTMKTRVAPSSVPSGSPDPAR